MALDKITYQEEPTVLDWIDAIAGNVSDHRGGARVSRADVIRWLTRNGKERYGNLSVGTMSAQI